MVKWEQNETLVYLQQRVQLYNIHSVPTYTDPGLDPSTEHVCEPE